MKKAVSAAALLSLLLLASCGPEKGTPKREDYISELSFRDDFKIVQLTDLHWGKATPMEEEKAYLRAIAEREDPDLIVITGDSLLTADAYVASTLYDTIESLGVPYAVTYGNHDYQGTYSPDFMDNLVTSGSNSVTRIVDDDVHGATNYAVELNREDGSVAWRINLIDSGSLIVESSGYVYDYIRDEQTDLYGRLQNDGAPNLLFFHIPLYEWAYAYDIDEEGLVGEINEHSTWEGENEDFEGKKETYPFFAGQVHSSIFAAAKESNCKGMFVGHDHSNDWVSSYEGITLGYGVKTGRGLYYANDGEKGFPRVGYASYVLSGDGSYDLSHVYFEDGTLIEHGRESIHVG